MNATRHRAALHLSAVLLLVGCTEYDLAALWDGLDDPHAAPARAAAVARLEATWDDAVSRGVSAVALVRHRGRVLARFAAGLSDRERGLPNTEDTAFDIGSVTKQFTGAAIMRLYEQGELELETPLGELFEGVPQDKRAITVHQLLTHTAGFTSNLGDDNEPILRDAYLERAWSTPLSAEPGTLHWYSNTGYSLLGAIIERLTGRPYEAYLVEELLRPAGLHETGYLTANIDRSRAALGYAEDDVDDPLERPHAPDGYYWNLRANGGLLSTAADLARWSDALRSGDVLGRKALRRYLAPHVPEGLGSDAYYAYGWAVSETPVGRLISHNGGNGFFFADVRQYVDADLLVVVLSNEATEAAYRLPFDLAHAALPRLPSSDDVPEPPPFPIDRLEELEDTTEVIVESVELTSEHERGTAGFFIELESGSVRYRVRAPDGELVLEAEAEAGRRVERLVAIPQRLGRWQLEIDAEAATGVVFFAWAWD